MPEALLHQLKQLARDIGGELDWFADRMDGLRPVPEVGFQPASVLEHIADRVGPSAPLTEAATQAALGAIYALPWRQSYNTADGFSQHYLENYAFLDLVSPEGMFLSDEIRVSLGFWSEGLRYPDHAHGPEEWYVMLAGGCTLTSDGIGSRPVMAGEVAHHAPWQRHSADFNQGSLLAVAYWRGAGLMDKPEIYETP